MPGLITFNRMERALLRTQALELGHIIAWPDYTIAGLRAGTRSGGRRGFEFRYSTTAISGSWHEFIPDRWYEDGRPCHFRYGALLGQATVTYARLKAWREQLPEQVHAQANVWTAQWPKKTCDYPALKQLAIAQLDDPEPADLLDLLPPPAEDGLW